MNITLDGKDYILLAQCPLLSTTEVLEFKTDVQQAIDGTETRLPLLDAARQTLNYSLNSYMANVSGMFSTFYQGLRKDYLIPQPLEYAEVSSVDNDFILCDTSQIEVAIGGYVLVGQQALKVLEIGRTSPTNDDGIRVHAEVTDTSLTVKPLRLCFIDGDATARLNALVFSPQVTFRTYEPIEYAASAVDTYTDCIIMDGDALQITFSQQQSIVDGLVGKIYSYTNWSSAKQQFNLRVLMKSRHEYMSFKRWLYRRRGMLNEFTMSMYEGSVSKVSRTYRLGSDSIEFNFLGANIVECSLPLVQV